MTRGFRNWALAALLILLPLTTSCRLFRRSKPVQPPVATTTPAPPSQPTPAPTKPPTEAQPAKPAQPAPAGQAKPPEQHVIKLPAPPPAKKRPSPAGPRVEASESPESPAAPAPAPAPQLRPMLTPEQRRQLDRTITARLQRARQALAILQERRLTAEQAEVVSQVRTFLKQAEETRATDLVRAGNLAERADVLAQDLVRTAK